ncbi:adenosylcobinamide-GDP ribazoletransferase [Dyadobacter frigoris]|uniref:Adenosylcobinamide-GDP ribazoletransferase n=1 Tax=Dyadobacter frigoris TaxID=2576211 RepID=A0A4U6D9H5_9BACT|nr:adenosylcobinamide-GDP ribazoletransferase [Dyadobacter frigoris]TKT94172.1 adenosylcobinamide-GDP ribazoletransferase [Dyadobacter frigoris]GLU50640.1 adenosylcobinamide-GDP ribazoletransferase [Dyadobacter frigoris]
MKQELRLFFTALQFYTRLPAPPWVGYNSDDMNKATRYLPLIGWIAGFTSCIFLLLGTYLIDLSTGLILSMISSILLTGAFHEDGFADACDGFGGGWTKEKILEIMKDSRVGTYAVVGLILLLGLKFSLLKALTPTIQDQPFLVLLTLISAHALSRFMAVTMIFTHAYVRFTNDSKSKPVAEIGNKNTLFIAAIFALIPLLVLCFLLNQPVLLLVVPFLYLIKIMLARYFTKWIGGYTGDCLGTTQQVSEIGFYLFTAVLWKFI